MQSKYFYFTNRELILEGTEYPGLFFQSQTPFNLGEYRTSHKGPDTTLSHLTEYCSAHQECSSSQIQSDAHGTQL